MVTSKTASRLNRPIRERAGYPEKGSALVVFHHGLNPYDLGIDDLPQIGGSRLNP